MLASTAQRTKLFLKIKSKNENGIKLSKKFTYSNTLTKLIEIINE